MSALPSAELEALRARIAVMIVLREAIQTDPDQVERTRRLGDIAAQITSAEMSEESLIRRLEAQGHPVLRRPDANPAVVLAP
jgi:hypothetical protein